MTNYIGGQFSPSQADKWIDVLDPSTQTLLSKVPETTEEEFNNAVEVAKDAFETWRKTSVLTRQRFALESVHLIRTTYPTLTCRQATTTNTRECGFSGGIHRS